MRGSAPRSALRILAPWILCALFLGCAAAGAPEGVPENVPPDRFATVDGHALAAPPGAFETPEELAAYLVAPARGDLEKARAIFRWIAANIDYDLQGALQGGGSGSADDAFRERTAVCGGFSDLFARLASASGLEAVRISGWARGMGYAVGDPVGGAPNHAWNAVRVDGRWILLDCTWGAGAVDETGTYRRRFEPWYFDPAPERLLSTHLPEDSAWQLVPNPMSREEFAARPYLRSTFFSRGLELVSPQSCVVGADGRSVAVVLRKPPGTFVVARLLRGDERLPQEGIRLRERGGTVTVEATPPGQEAVVLRIFAGDAGTTEGRVRRYEWAADFKISASEPPETSAGAGGEPSRIDNGTPRRHPSNLPRRRS